MRYKHFQNGILLTKFVAIKLLGTIALLVISICFCTKSPVPSLCLVFFVQDIAWGFISSSGARYGWVRSLIFFL